MGHSTEPPRHTGGQSGQSTPGDEPHSAAGHSKTGAIGNSRNARAADRGPASSGGHSHDTDRTAPTGMGVLPVVLALFGLPLSAFGLWITRTGRTASAYDPTGGSWAIAAVGVLMVAFGVGYLLAAYGTWRLKPWGWTLAVGLLGAGALSSLLVLTGSGSGVGLVGLLANGGLCWYLYANRSLYRRLAGSG